MNLPCLNQHPRLTSTGQFSENEWKDKFCVLFCFCRVSSMQWLPSQPEVSVSLRVVSPFDYITLLVRRATGYIGISPWDKSRENMMSYIRQLSGSECYLGFGNCSPNIAFIQSCITASHLCSLQKESHTVKFGYFTHDCISDGENICGNVFLD